MKARRPFKSSDNLPGSEGKSKGERDPTAERPVQTKADNSEGADLGSIAEKWAPKHDYRQWGINE